MIGTYSSVGKREKLVENAMVETTKIRSNAY